MTEPNQLDEIDELLALLIQREITPADFSNAIQVIIAKAQEQAISDYQTNIEQKHIAEAIKIARTEAIDQTLGLNETERFDGLNEHQKQILIDYHTRCLNELNKGVDNG